MMRRAAGTLLRVGVSLAILAALVLFISPRQVWQTLSACEWRWLLATLVLLPPFLLFRIAKWHVLVRQTSRSIGVLDVVRGYLWGMAIGLVTPGRTGELARIWAAGLPSRCIGLFILEKAVEITVIALLGLLSLATLDAVPLWLPVGGLVLLVTCLSVWRGSVKAVASAAHRLLGWPSRERLHDFKWAVSEIRVGKCAAMSAVCLLIFCLQSYLMLNSAGQRYDFVVVRFVPMVFVANLIPITIGGLGLRETLGVVLLRGEGIPPAVAMTSFALVTLVNLFLPAVIGAVLVALRPVRRAGRFPKPESAPANREQAQALIEPLTGEPTCWKSTATADAVASRAR
jgi:uncharacterized membrane protein YbhN (UPF0104 family)